MSAKRSRKEGGGSREAAGGAAERLVLVEDVDVETWYKDEGGNSNRLSVTVGTDTGSVPDKVVLECSVVYENGEVVEEREKAGLLTLCKKDYQQYVLSPSAPQVVVEFRFEKVSRRKDGQRFRLRISMDAAQSAPQPPLAPVDSAPVLVMSKRRTGQRVVSRPRAVAAAAGGGGPGGVGGVEARLDRLQRQVDVLLHQQALVLAAIQRLAPVAPDAMPHLLPPGPGAAAVPAQLSRGVSRLSSRSAGTKRTRDGEGDAAQRPAADDLAEDRDHDGQADDDDEDDEEWGMRAGRGTRAHRRSAAAAAAGQTLARRRARAGSAARAVRAREQEDEDEDDDTDNYDDVVAAASSASAAQPAATAKMLQSQSSLAHLYGVGHMHSFEVADPAHGLLAAHLHAQPQPLRSAVSTLSAISAGTPLRLDSAQHEAALAMTGMAADAVAPLRSLRARA